MDPEDALRQTAFEILEEQMFLFISEVPATTLPEDAVRYRMSIEGSFPAEIGLEAHPDAARHLASEMLGVDLESIGETEVSAAVAEALNIVAGRVMMLVAGGGPELELRPPVAGGDAHGAIVAFDAGAGELHLWLAA